MQAKKTKILKQVLNHAYSNRDEQLFYCPFCDHHKPKLSVNVEKGVFKCWVCDVRGKNLYYLIKRFGNFHQQQEYLRIEGSTEITEFENLFASSEEEEKEQIVELPKEFVSLTDKTPGLTSTPALKYLEKRGISKKDILKWKIGHCVSGEYKNRIIIPSFNEDGKVNYFIARALKDEFLKYKNPPASKNIIFNELWIDWESPIVLVEGVFDAFKEENMIPILGSTLRENSKIFQKVIENGCKIYLALDSDAFKKEKDIMLKLLDYGIEIYKIDTTGYEDIFEMPGEIYFERKKQSSVINRDNFFEYQFLCATF